MKKKSFILAATVVLAAVGCFIASGTFHASKDVISENVEALMDLELIAGGTFIVTAYSDDHWLCEQGGGYYCPMP